MRPQSAAFVATTIFTHTAEARTCHGDLSVRTKGGVVHGTADSATPAVRQFLGIPYGQPPLNELRFAPPRPALPFGNLDASKMPPSCMQYLSNAQMGPFAADDLLGFNLAGLNTTGPVSEDCLTLSIWAPRKEAEENLPVLMFFYGGAFTTGGIDIPYAIPARWIQRTQNHIVVSFNHRDNIFGFPNAAGLSGEEQNIGLLDMRLAIEWVRDNIAAFGGDPKRIGIWGQSSGGVAIAYYSYVYTDNPIVNSIIMDSGNEFIDILTRDSAHANFTYIASQFGCGNLGPAEELACMRKVDPVAMEEFMRTYYDEGKTPLITFSPIIDNRTVFENYTALGEAGYIARLPALIGSNAQDGSMFVPYDPSGVPDMALADEMTSVFFFCPTYQSAKTRIAARTGPVYRYLYNGNFTNISPKSWMGAWHGAELPLLFGTDALYHGDSSELESLTSHAMQDAWVAFVATAGEKMTVEGWDRWDEVGGGQVVEFGNGLPAKLVNVTELEQRCGQSM